MAETAAVTGLPAWYDQLSQNMGNQIAGGLNQVQNLTKNWYDQPLTQGLNAAQQGILNQSTSTGGQWQTPYNAGLANMNEAGSAWGNAGTAAGNITSGVTGAQNLWNQGQGLWGQAGTTGQNMTSGLGAAASDWTGAQNYYNQAGAAAGTMNNSAGDFTQAGNDLSAARTQAGQYGSVLNPAQGQWGQAAQNYAGAEGMVPGMASGLGTGQQAWTTAAGMVGQAGEGLAGAGSYDPAQMAQHLSPYLAGAQEDIRRRGIETLNEDILPGVNQSFTGSGTFGSSRHQDFTQRALRNAEREIAAAQANAGNQAYNQAAQDYLGWGQLGSQAAGKYGDLANTLASIGQQQANTPANIYGQQANTLAQLGQARAGLGTTEGTLGLNSLGQQISANQTNASQQAQLGTNRANIAAQQAGIYGNLGGQMSALGQQRATTPANIYGNLANLQQGLGSAAAGQGTSQLGALAGMYGNQASAYGNQAGGLGSLGGAMGQLGLAGQNQSWTDLTNQYQMQDQERVNKQGALDAQYKDWQTQLSTPYNLMGALGTMAQGVVAPYRGATSTGGSSSINDILSIIAAGNTGARA